MTPPKILVAIPSYRCEAQIGRVVAAFTSALLSRVEKVMIIDNQSPDATIERARAAITGHPGRGKFEIARNTENYGLGGSHKVAFRHAEAIGADYVAILHGDDQGKAEELGLLIDAAIAHPGAAAALGARFMPGSQLEGYSKLRIAGNIGLNLLYSAASFRATYDMGSGLNLFRVADLRDHRYLAFSDAFTFNMDLLLDYYRRGAELRFVPITWRETDQVSNAKTLKVGWIALKTLLKWRAGLASEPPAAGRSYSFEKVYP